jgi:hypothetical protein
METEKRFTLKEIEIAFRKKFDKSGEHWFSYFKEDAEQNKLQIDNAWQSFIKYLFE